MYRETLKEILGGYVDTGRLDVELNSLWATLDGQVQCFNTVDDAHSACEQFSGDVPVTLVPLGCMKDGGLMGLHLCSVAAERRIFPLIRAASGIFWEPMVQNNVVTVAGAPGDSRPARPAPTSFMAALELAERASASDKKVSLLALAFKRPVYTAGSLAAVTGAQRQILALEEHRGIDFQAVRLARAGQDGEAWRIIGAERAIAGRIRDVLVALEGALVFGCNRPAAFKVLGGMFKRGGWEWAGRLLRFHAERE